MHDEDDYGVMWSQRFGAECPKCGSYTKHSYKHSSWHKGLKVRYHVCPNPECHERFQSVADDSSFKHVQPDPEKLQYLRGYQSKHGVKKGGIVVNQQLVLPFQSSAKIPLYSPLI